MRVLFLVEYKLMIHIQLKMSHTQLKSSCYYQKLCIYNYSLQNDWKLQATALRILHWRGYSCNWNVAEQKLDYSWESTLSQVNANDCTFSPIQLLNSAIQTLSLNVTLPSLLVVVNERGNSRSCSGFDLRDRAQARIAAQASGISLSVESTYLLFILTAPIKQISHQQLRTIAMYLIVFQ